MTGASTCPPHLNKKQKKQQVNVKKYEQMYSYSEPTVGWQMRQRVLPTYIYKKIGELFFKKIANVLQDNRLMTNASMCPPHL